MVVLPYSVAIVFALRRTEESNLSRRHRDNANFLLTHRCNCYRIRSFGRRSHDIVAHLIESGLPSPIANQQSLRDRKPEQPEMQSRKTMAKINLLNNCFVIYFRTILVRLLAFALHEIHPLCRRSAPRLSGRPTLINSDAVQSRDNSIFYVCGYSSKDYRICPARFHMYN